MRAIQFYDYLTDGFKYKYKYISTLYPLQIYPQALGLLKGKTYQNAFLPTNYTPAGIKQTVGKTVQFVSLSVLLVLVF